MKLYDPFVVLFLNGVYDLACAASILAEGGSVVHSRNALAQLHPFMYTQPGHATLNRHVAYMVGYCGAARLYAATGGHWLLAGITYVMEAAFVAHEAALYHTMLQGRAAAVFGVCVGMAGLMWMPLFG